MKKIILLLLCLIGFYFNAQNVAAIKILGKTNVNNFKCINNNIYTKSSIILPKESDEKTSNSTVNLVVNDFSCENRMMTIEFRKTLNAERFPFLQLRFISISKKNSNIFTSNIEVKMMNSTKIYTIDFLANENFLIGKKTVKFSDFGISPPKKMGGLVVVKDDLDLQFSLPYKN